MALFSVLICRIVLSYDYIPRRPGVGILSQRVARAGGTGRAVKEARPTSGKVLLALLNILDASGRLDGASVLDLFSGTGQVSLAMLGRGAMSALAVESERERATAVSASFGKKGYSESARCVCGDVRRILPKLARSGEHFDVVFADPPYSLGWGEKLTVLMGENWGILAEEGVFVFERAAREELPPLEYGGQRIERDVRVYGDTVLSFYWNGGRNA